MSFCFLKWLTRDYALSLLCLWNVGWNFRRHLTFSSEMLVEISTDIFEGGSGIIVSHLFIISFIFSELFIIHFSIFLDNHYSVFEFVELFKPCIQGWPVPDNAHQRSGSMDEPIMRKSLERSSGPRVFDWRQVSQNINNT